MRVVLQRTRQRTSHDTAEELPAKKVPAVQLTLRSGRADTLAHDGVTHLQRTAGNAGVAGLLSIQRGRERKGQGVAVKTKADAPAVDAEVVALKVALSKYDESDELNASEAHAFQRSLSMAAGLPFKGHPPHGSNFDKRQTLKAVVQNWWDGLHPNTRKRFRPALDATFGTGEF